MVGLGIPVAGPFDVDGDFHLDCAVSFVITNSSKGRGSGCRWRSDAGAGSVVPRSSLIQPEHRWQNRSRQSSSPALWANVREKNLLLVGYISGSSVYEKRLKIGFSITSERSMESNLTRTEQVRKTTPGTWNLKLGSRGL